MDWSKVLAPIKALLQDRVFITSLLSAIGAVLVNLVPAIQPYMPIIVPSLIAVILMAAGATAISAPIKIMSAARVEAAKAQAAPSATLTTAH